MVFEPFINVFFRDFEFIFDLLKIFRVRIKSRNKILREQLGYFPMAACFSNSSKRNQAASFLPSINTKSKSCRRNYSSSCNKKRKVHANHFEIAQAAPPSRCISRDVINSKVVVIDGSDQGSQPTTSKPDFIDEKKWKVLSLSGGDLYVPNLPSDPKKGLIVNDQNGNTICRLWPREATLNQTGLLSQKKSKRLFNNYLDIKKNTPRSLERGMHVFSDSKYVGKLGYGPQRYSRGVCRSPHWNIPECDLPLKGVVTHIRQLVNGFQRWESKKILVMAEHASNLINYQTLPGCQYFSACAFGQNVHLQVHTDKDALTSITTVLTENPCLLKQDAVVHFCFPEAGVAVPMRPGDVISFAPQEPHAISSRSKFEDNLICMSVYTKSAVVGLYNNKIPLTQLEKELADAWRKESNK